MRIRKQTPGTSSHGHEWTGEGDVVDVPDYEAMELLIIPDGDFSEAENDETTPAKPAAQDSGDETKRSQGDERRVPPRSTQRKEIHE